MNLKYPANLIKLVLNIADKKNTTETVIDFLPQKVSVTPEYDKSETALPEASPEELGVSRHRIRNYLEALKNDRSVSLHSVLIAKDGYEIARFDNIPYSSEKWHVSYSMCKTVVGLAVGLLIEEGKLSVEDKVLKIFGKKLPLTVNIKSWSMTVKHLLTMQSGVTFNEAGAVSEDKWTEAFLSSQLLFEPGKDFLYNSMNTYMLAAIVKEITGEGLVEYLTPRLFEPMGIKRFLWEKSPEGIEKGGWGLYIMPSDMLKLGVLFQQYGKWDGKQLIPEKWITEMSSPQCAVPEYLSGHKYGYQMWCKKKPSMCLMNGLFGQNVHIFHDTGIVVASTAGNGDMFHANNLFAITEQFWGYKSRLLNDRQVVTGLNDTGDKTARFYVSEGRLKTQAGKKYPVKLLRYVNKSFDMDKKAAKNAGIMPILLQLTHNNYTKGLKSLAFTEKEGVFFIVMTEGDDVYEIPVGFGEYAYSDVTFNGEKFSVAADGVVTSDEDGVPCLKVKIHYLEMASVRYIKVFFYENGITTRWNETPGENFLDKGFEWMFDGMRTNKLFATLLDKIKPEAVSGRVKRFFSARTDGSVGVVTEHIVSGRESVNEGELPENGDTEEALQGNGVEDVPESSQL